ncbi:MAG: type VII toxin-antitoxin system HepT family RNase toxin [Limnochordia bacterium]|jgi:uncharacterized protein YutE (UPF0331/DUF86 family)
MTGAMPDRGVIERRLTYLIDAVQVLREYRGMTLDELAASPKVYWAVQHGLQLCVQSVLDVASHCVASLGGPVPDRYRDNISALAPLGILPKAFAERMAPMAGFRNILVHEYTAVDLREVHRVLTEQLDDFVEFAQHVNAYLEQQRDQ